MKKVHLIYRCMTLQRLALVEQTKFQTTHSEKRARDECHQLIRLAFHAQVTTTLTYQTSASTKGSREAPMDSTPLTSQELQLK